MSSTHTVGVLALLAALLFGGLQSAQGQEIPPRKPGLWKQTQHESQNGGSEQVEVIYQCADQASDKKMHQLAKEMGSCTEEPLKRKGETLAGRSVCNLMGSKVAVDYVITGDMDSEYRVETRSKIEPPLFNQSGGRSVLVAQWQGPCKPGQNPGDMIVQGDGGEETLNMNALTDAKGMEAAKELMQSQGIGQMMEQLQKLQGPGSGEAVDMQAIHNMLEQLGQQQKPQK